MKATRFSLSFIALALCGHGQAGPCKLKPTTTISSALEATSSIEATLSATNEIETSTGIETSADATVVAESSSTDLSSFISESGSSTATATSDAQLSSSTKLSTSSVTTETFIESTTTAELSSTTEVLTTTNTAETTSSEVPTTTTTVEESGPTQLFLNPSFEDQNGNGDFDGSPWVLYDDVIPYSVQFKSGLGHTGSHSAYFTITSTAQNGRVYQPVDLEQSHFYHMSYWWYVDEDQQPTGLSSCYIYVEQKSLDGRTSSFPEFLGLPQIMPLKTWTKHEFLFNSINIAPANMAIHVECAESAGSGLKVAIDDIELTK
ncbi:hypothetical protein FLONG3_6661 [Fusarium longipes]|uniref:CBM-cenC domain-containing protein n=1 Tax=Fusarium longipes TaxID=694270 RepID=A0A395SJM8_9HYPO|nr:hypothetical protein FLONG3_6661 [Fusarium longipes]